MYTNQERYNVLEESLQVHVHESRTLQYAGEVPPDVCTRIKDVTMYWRSPSRCMYTNQERYNMLKKSLQMYVHESRTLQCTGGVPPGVHT